VKLYPESTYIVTVTHEGIRVGLPGGAIQQMPLETLRRILVETNDTGPWGIDVWWVLEGESPEDCVRFPQGATGEDGFIEYAGKLPGFAIRGMNSSSNAIFECWPNPSK